jgi:hypothetical protein
VLYVCFSILISEVFFANGVKKGIKVTTENRISENVQNNLINCHLSIAIEASPQVLFSIDVLYLFFVCLSYSV